MKLMISIIFSNDLFSNLYFKIIYLQLLLQDYIYNYAHMDFEK